MNRHTIHYQMRVLLAFAFVFFLQKGYGQVLLNADGPGNTYELISSILAPGYNPIEVPDCNHSGFGNHIDEVFDNDLNTNVFRFYIHTTPDNDRCINFDRQRNEIKAYDKSPDNLLGIEGEKVIYKWKFKLDSGFQSSPNFTHIHQLKSVGGSLASMPMYTLTTRKGSPDRLELRYAETNRQLTLTQTALAPFVNTWLDVTETIVYGTSGSYEIEIKNLSKDSTLFSYSNTSIINWRPGASFVRPKWGIYRSLVNVQDLRDETVLFADFSIEEVEVTTSVQPASPNEARIVFSNPISQTLYIKDVFQEINQIKISGLDGRIVMDKILDPKTEVKLDVSSLATGTYILHFLGKKLYQSQLILIN